MKPFPDVRPPIEIDRIEEAPFEVECRELPWYFTRLETRQRGRCASYDFPSWEATEIEEVDVGDRCKVYGHECYEARHRYFSPDGALRREACSYSDIRDNVQRWFGWWNMSDEDKFYTCKDPYFWDSPDAEWPDAPMHMVDVGGIKWVSDDHVELLPFEKPSAGVNQAGAGLWRVRIGEREWRCLRFIENRDQEGQPLSLTDGFLTEAGGLVLARYYRSSNCWMTAWNGQTAAEFLKGSQTFVCGGVTYYLWYDRIGEQSLAPSSHQFVIDPSGR